MVRAGAGFSTAPEAAAAVEQAAAAALERAGGADAALLFAAPGYGPEPRALLDAAVSALGTECVVGASAHGVLAAGRESEADACLAVLALTGLDAHPFLLTDLAGDEAHAGEEIAARIGGAPRPEDLVVLLPDPRAIQAEALLAGIRSALAPAAVVGAGAAAPLSATPLQWSGRRAASGGLAGLVLRGRCPPRIGVTQSCRPATGLLTVTRAQGNWVLELDGRPALDVYREVSRGPLAEDLRRAAAFVLVALPRDAAAPLSPGGYLVRNVVGFATGDHAFAVPEAVRPGQQLALALREPESARDDLKEMLAGLAGRPGGAAAAGLYFDCCARGSSLFGVDGLEAAYLESALGDVPVAGLFGSCEIGPVGGRTELLTYTGVLALLDDPG